MTTVGAMSVHALFTAEGDDAVVLAVHAQPGAGRTQVVGRHGDALKIRVAAPPEGGRANDALVAVLSDQFGVPAKAVTLTVGATSRTKRFRIQPVDPSGFESRLEQVLDEAEGSAPGGRGRR
jgi:uncharacterized protein (TIGR00251 family)